jgi:hypothetical protein
MPHGWLAPDGRMTLTLLTTETGDPFDERRPGLDHVTLVVDHPG